MGREDRNALGGRATFKEVTITFGLPELRPMHLMLVVPNRREVPAPVVLGMNYFGNHTLLREPAIALSTNWMPERGTGVVNNLSTEASRGTWADIWRIEYLVDRGYALATFYNGDIDPDRPDARGVQTYYRRFDPAPDCATIAAWAWGLSRAVDYLVTDKDVDRQRIVVTGHSRLGKAALLAAALDERIALVIPHQAGSGGSAPSRTHVKPAISSRRENAPYPLKAPETVRQINDRFPHWFNARFKEFNDRPERLPFDQHCLVALCAPRPVLFTNGRDDTWINPDGQFEVLRAAVPVYRLLVAGDFTATNPHLEVAAHRMEAVVEAMHSLAALIIHIRPDITGGTNTITIKPASLFGMVLSSQSRIYYVIMFCTVVVIYLMRNLARCKIGRAFIAIRDNDLAAEVMGLEIFRYKLLSFFICSLLAGLAGGLWTIWMGSVNVDIFTLEESVWYLGMIIVGGLGSVAGAVFGVIFIRLYIFLSLFVHRRSAVFSQLSLRLP